MEKWLKNNQILQRKCEVVIFEIEGRRKRANIATITGASIGIFGAVVAGFGLLLAPLTAGVSTVISVGGAVLGFSGGGITTGSKIVEFKLNHGSKDALKRYHNCQEETYTSFMAIIDRLEKEIKDLEKISPKIKTNQIIESSDFSGYQTIPGAARVVEGAAMVPLSLLVSTGGINVLSVIIGPASALIDTALLIFSATNMTRGNITNVTENLRRTCAALYGSRRLVHHWAFGNQKPYNYD